MDARALLLASLLAASPLTLLAAEPASVDGVTVSPPAKCLPPHVRPTPGVPAPRVVSTFPARGAVVRPGLLVVRITVDLPMACGGAYLDAAPLRAPFPSGDRQVRLSSDRRTFRVLGAVAANGSYGFWMNRAPVRDFVGISGRPMEPYNLTFRTSDGAPVTTVTEALAQDPSAP